VRQPRFVKRVRPDRLRAYLMDYLGHQS
jgi:hypothetical protein